MTATGILKGLEGLDLTGEDAAAAARLGFLEWVFTQTGETTSRDAEKALHMLATSVPESDAAQAFVQYLRDACVQMPSPKGRTGRARRLH